ncbi:putative Stachyose synthase [Melia azedarach]|uniref:Stachyose synthase n=1 Tax=Melia azedarach TaxID=155640 RepID=A0ACC1YVU8_MELAZ|nr:putative Stachyose synthase [Melia azedarach]
METQWVLLDVPETSSYVIIIPSIDGSFRSALHPGTDGHVMICAESGSTKVKAPSFDAIAYVHVSDNPYNIMKEAYTALRVHLNTFRLLEEKQVPSLVDKFGWFLIIDDGWQSINRDDENPNEDSKNFVPGGEQMTARLYRLLEGEKFRKYKGGSLLAANAPAFDIKRPKMLINKGIELEHANKDRDKAIPSGVTDLSQFDSKIKKLKQELEEMFGAEESSAASEGCGSCSCKAENNGMKAFTKDLRTKFKGLDDIWVWHALCGAWGGVRPGATHLNSKIIPCNVSPGLDGTMDDLAVIKIVEGGIGLVHPSQAGDFYDSMHSYLSQVGVTGVKVDVIHTLEYVSEEYGGRVELGEAYYKGLSNSLIKNFKGTGIISSMQQCNDFSFLGTSQISMGRVGDNFLFQDPNGDPNGVYWLQGVHMIHCSYNSLWMGQFIQPDWDMFQSDHCCAKFHAGSRAICGGPVYVSDSLGGHDFEFLKQLVYPDGTIPKCQHFALPSRDCLFKNPLFDKHTILKIWNFNKYGGVIGAFNCQGAGWDKKEQRIKGYPECYKPVSGSVHAEKLHLMTRNSEPIQITLQPLSFEIFSFVPIKKLGPGIKFAPIGVINLLNNGGTIRELEYLKSGAEISAKSEVKGGGKFLAYSSRSPKKCLLNGAEVAFEWSTDGKLTMDVPWIEEVGGICNAGFLF